MARKLNRLGITAVRPLAGGLDAWEHRGYPLARVATSGKVASAS